MKTKIKLFILIILFASNSYSSELMTTFLIENKNIEFIQIEQRHLTISSNCFEKGELKKCKASEAMKRADLDKLNKDLFGRNPGALLCDHQLGGIVVWARDIHGNERTFCKFDDGTFVGSGTLSYYGSIKNKK
jgi:hypothetical protein